MKVEPTYFYRRWQNNVETMSIELRWFNIDDPMLFQRWYYFEKESWVNTCSSVLRKQHWNNLCQYFLYWGSLESGSKIKQNKFPNINLIFFLYKNTINLFSTVMKWSYWMALIWNILHFVYNIVQEISQIPNFNSNREHSNMPIYKTLKGTIHKVSSSNSLIFRQPFTFVRF